MQSIFSKTEELSRANVPAALCIVVESHGSTPRKAGAKMVVLADGSIYGTIGGGGVEQEVIGKALKLIASGKIEKCSFNLENDLSMQCGGTLEVYIEPLDPVQKLIIFGGGHIGKALIRFASEFNFNITVVDSRENIFQNPLFAGCNCINKDYFTVIDELVFDENSYIVIVTSKHAFDEDILIRVARKPHAYIGMIGSKNKVGSLKERVLKENLLTQEELDKMDMPIGIKFNAETPQEIAISILAKLIDTRNNLLNKYR